MLQKVWLLVLSRGVASYDEENFAKVNRLFPATTEPTTGYMEGREDPTPTIILAHDIAKYIGHASEGTSPGPEGLRIEHLKDAIKLPLKGLVAAILEELAKLFPL